MSKGSKRRPTNETAYRKRYGKVFGKRKSKVIKRTDLNNDYTAAEVIQGLTNKIPNEISQHFPTRQEDIDYEQ